MSWINAIWGFVKFTIIHGDSATGKIKRLNFLEQAANLGESLGVEVICDCRVLNHILEGAAQRIGYGPLSPRSRLVQNVADAKLVRNLVKHRRFSIGSIEP